MNATERTWNDVHGDRLTVERGAVIDPHWVAAYAYTDEDGVYLTASQCREVAAYLTDLADAHEKNGTPHD